MIANILNFDAIHAGLTDAMNRLWFAPKPDDEIIITDEKVRHRLLKLHFTVEFEQKRFGVICDPVLSNSLGASVYYLSSKRKHSLVKYINERCGLGIELDVRYLKLRFDNKYFIIANYDTGINTYDYDYDYRYYPITHCLRTQCCLNDYMEFLIRRLYIEYQNLHGGAIVPTTIR